MPIRTLLAFIIAPWATALFIAAVLSMYPILNLDRDVFWFYLLWLGVGGELISLTICAPTYLIARRLTKLTGSKVVIGSGFVVALSVGLLSFAASSRGMRVTEDFNFDLFSGAVAFGLMGAIGGAVFWLLVMKGQTAKR